MATAIESIKEFEKTPTGQAKRWQVEMKAAQENMKSFLERGDKVVKRFLDDRTTDNRGGDTRINLFTANVQTLRALLYGKTPSVDVKRRFADPDDDPARLAGEILQRLLNTDIERDSDTYAEALERCLDDRLLPGLGVARARYVAEFGVEEVPAIPDAVDPVTGSVRKGAPAYQKESKTYENVDIDYVHWRDFRYSPARTWEDVRWIAFKIPMTRDALRNRFGKKIGDEVPLNSKAEKAKFNVNDEGEKNIPWARAEVWEIWSKEDKEVVWWVDGYGEVLDTKADTLELDGFWPVSRPMFANLTTTKLIPTPDFTLAQDLYDEVDLVSTRITLLERAVVVRGVYDKTSPEIERLLDEAGGNRLIPTDNFALFKEKGGLQSVVDWMPLEQIVGALEVLKTYRTELMGLLFQVTGMSDIMRGQADAPATATEQALKAKFASTRVQEFQNEFARFASDLQKLKAEIISKHFDPKTIIERSNVKFMTGSTPEQAQAAIGIIKSDFYQYRIEVRPESVAMADMTAMKAERSEFLMAVATFLQSSQPIVAGAPWAAPYLLQMLQWSMAGFRGGATIEGVLDQMVVAARQAQQQAASQPPPPDPKIEQMKMQAQIDMTKSQQEMQMASQKNQMEIEKQKILTQLQIQKANLDLEIAKAKAQVDMQKGAVDLEMKQQDQALDVRKSEMEFQHEAKSMELAQENAQVEHAISMEQGAQSHEMKLKQMKEQAKAKPKATPNK